MAPIGKVQSALAGYIRWYIHPLCLFPAWRTEIVKEVCYFYLFESKFHLLVSKADSSNTIPSSMFA